MVRHAHIVALLVWLTVSLAAAAAPVSEEEPNNCHEKANALRPGEEMTGTISPAGDRDYYALAGLGTTWGFVALVDTSGATTFGTATLEALRSDGATVLQSDSGSWERGAGIALQAYVDGGDAHYLRVGEAGDDDTVAPYVLRMYNTVVDAQPEAEPNGTRITGTPSSFTHRGTISAPDDQDCYAFHGRAGDSIIIALNGDGRPLDAALELVGPDDSSLHSVNVTGVGGQEFLEYDDLPEDGAYAYCVLPAAGSGTGGTATYRVGLVRNGALYYPDWEHGIKWLNRPPEGYTSPGKELLFRIAVQNTSPLTIPGGIDLGLDYPASCLSFIEADPSPASLSAGSISWAGLKPDLAPGDVYSASARLRAEAGCVADVSMSLNLPYYVTYVSSSTRMAVYDHFLRLPVIRRTAP